MRSNLPTYELREARDLTGALAMIASGGGGESGGAGTDAWKPFAGGTDLMVLFEAGKLTHRRFVSIWNLRELRGISESPEALNIGAATTYADIRRHPSIARDFPLLQRAAAETGSIATQNRAPWEGISPTPLPPRIRRPLWWSTMRSWSWFRPAAHAGFPT